MTIFNYVGVSFIFSSATRSGDWKIIFFDFIAMCCMLTTFLVSSRNLAKYSGEHPLTFLKSSCVAGGDRGHYQKLYHSYLWSFLPELCFSMLPSFYSALFLLSLLSFFSLWWLLQHVALFSPRNQLSLVHTLQYDVKLVSPIKVQLNERLPLLCFFFIPVFLKVNCGL